MLSYSIHICCKPITIPSDIIFCVVILLTSTYTFFCLRIYFSLQPFATHSLGDKSCFSSKSQVVIMYPEYGSTLFVNTKSSIVMSYTFSNFCMFKGRSAFSRSIMPCLIHSELSCCSCTGLDTCLTYPITSMEIKNIFSK